MSSATPSSNVTDLTRGRTARGIPEFEFRVEFTGQAPFDRARACVHALDTLPVAAHESRARALATLAAAQTVTEPDAAQHTALRSRHEAQLAGTPRAHGFALLAQCVVDLSPESLESRLRDSGRVLTIALGTGERQLAEMGYFMHLSALIEKGDIAALDAELMPNAGILSSFPELADGRHANWFRCMRATLDGQTERAERLASHACEVATAADDPDATIVWTAQIAIIRWMQGRLAEMEPVFLQARQAFPGDPVWAASVAWIWANSGRSTAAQGLVETLRDIDAFPRDRNWLAAVAILSEVAAELGDRQLVDTLYSALVPFEHRLVPIGAGVICWGTVARPLALLAMRQGRIDDSIAHLRTAIDVSSRIGAQAWLAQAQFELAEILSIRSGHTPEVGQLTDESLAAVRQLGLVNIERRSEKLVRRTQAASVSTTPPPTVPARTPSIQVLGKFEVRSADGTLATWTSRKARSLLKLLIARHGAPTQRELVMESLWPGEAPADLSNRLSVAVATVRRALDPARTRPANTYLAVDRAVLSLRIRELRVDVEEFLALANAATSSTEITFDELKAAVTTAPEQALADEPDAPWAEQLRRQVHAAFFAASHTLATAALEKGDHLLRAETYRGILRLDAYDEVAHKGLVDALKHLGAHGQAAEAQTHFEDQMMTLGITVID